jgi:hypothetical protein
VGRARHAGAGHLRRTIRRVGAPAAADCLTDALVG